MKTLSSIIRDANESLIVRGEFEAIASYFATDYVAHVTDRELLDGRMLVRKQMELYKRAFPRISLRVDILIEGPDRVAWQRTLRAKHEGAFKGFPASGLEIVWRDVVTSRFDQEVIVEDWVISDLAEQLLLSRKKI